MTTHEAWDRLAETFGEPEALDVAAQAVADGWTQDADRLAAPLAALGNAPALFVQNVNESVAYWVETHGTDSLSVLVLAMLRAVETG